jgi:uncharacterized membrane protein
LLLVSPFLLLAAIGRFAGFEISRSKRARVGLTLFFLATGLAHFANTEPMAEMIPPSIPYRVELIYVTGIFELLGAIGVWIPRLVRLTGLLLIVMLIAVLPANVYSALNRVEFGGHGAGPAYLLVRVPFQLFVIWWTYFATQRRET